MGKLLGVFFMLLSTCCSSSSTSRNAGPTPKAATITNLCELVDNPERFVGKQVRVRAALRFGLHYIDLYSVRCNDPKNTTIDFVSAESTGDLRPCADAGSLQTHPNESKTMGGGTYGIDVEGKLVAAPDPPFVNPFRYKFSARCVYERKVLWDLGNGPWALPPEIRRMIEQYETNS